MLILATDMARHSEIVERFKSKLDTFDFSNDDYVSSVSEWTKFVQGSCQGCFNTYLLRLRRKFRCWFLILPPMEAKP